MECEGRHAERYARLMLGKWAPSTLLESPYEVVTGEKGYFCS